LSGAAPSYKIHRESAVAYDPNLHHRRSLRRDDFNYAAAGAYFVTICAFEKRCIFGSAQDGAICPSPLGAKVHQAWLDLPLSFKNVQLDEFVLMPNHLHGILMLSDGGGPGPTLGVVIAVLKSRVTRQIKAESEALNRSKVKVWQRNYYESIVRDEEHLLAARRYITENPQRWLNAAPNGPPEGYNDGG
jgi:REP element-mobilizing transposase RayT